MDEKARKPEKQQAIYDKGYWWFICPYCKRPIDYKKDCKWCGEQIDWSETSWKELFKDGEQE